ncbi:GFA family protein [Oceanisphaera sp. KMM 10153]|uniref:GFA family protein n=1 Tax=Oceanisphaera submarina TaxID=3390193 RepID=UPI0039761C06
MWFSLQAGSCCLRFVHYPTTSASVIRPSGKTDPTGPIRMYQQVQQCPPFRVMGRSPPLVYMNEQTVVKCHRNQCRNNQCRKLQGEDYSYWVVVPQSQFNITSGEDNVSTYKASDVSSKFFYSNCGSAAYFVNGKCFPDDDVLPLGAVESYVNELAPRIQVYTTGKAPWVTLHDDEPIYS